MSTRQRISHAITTELERQADERTQYYQGPDESGYWIEYDGSIALGEFVDAIEEAIRDPGQKEPGT